MKTLKLFSTSAMLALSFGSHFLQAQNWAIPPTGTAVGTTSIGITGAGGNPLKISADNTSGIQFYTGGVQRAAFDQTGNFAIGTNPGTSALANFYNTNTAVRSAALFHNGASSRLSLYAAYLAANSPYPASTFYLFGTSNTSTEFYVKEGGDTYISGKLGIGTTAPAYALDVSGTTRITGAATLSSTLAVTGATTLNGGLTVNGYGSAQQMNLLYGAGDGYDYGALRIGKSSSSYWHIGQSSSNNVLRIMGNNNGSWVYPIVMDFATGNVGINNVGTIPTHNFEVNGTSKISGRVDIGGTTLSTSSTYATDANLKFTVNGIAIAKKFVCTSLNWADYVFDKKYALAPLSEVESFVAEHKHLPGIPSASEVEKEGVDTGEMLRMQMEKIEELTLHLIRMQKELDHLKGNSK